jgi:DNA-binding transcriptional LysR family regulator
MGTCNFIKLWCADRDQDMSSQTPSIRELEAFRETLQSGSATRAADRLGISQPAVSRAIAQLESRIGVVLFRREDGRLRPTADALALSEELTSVFNGLANIQSFSTRKRPTGGGRLRIAIPPSFGTAFVHQQIASFSERYPETAIYHELCTNAEAIRIISTGEADIGLTTSPISHEGVRYETLTDVDVVCIMPAGHRLSKQDVVHATDLDNEPFIAISRVHSSRHMLDRILEKAGVRPKTIIETTASISACDFVAEGLGVAVINPFPVLDWYGDKIVARKFSPDFPYRVSIMITANPETDWACRAFVGQLKRNAASKWTKND